MSFASARKNLQAYFSENFSGVPASQIAWDNVRFTPIKGEPWVRVNIQNNVSDFVAFNGSSVLNRVKGLLFIQVFTPEGEGTLESDVICDDVTSTLQGTQLASGESISSVSKNELGSSNGWFQVNMIAEFYYDLSIIPRQLVYESLPGG